MATIAGFVGMSHSPFATLLPPAADTAPGGSFLRDAGRVRASVDRLSPDAIVVIGPDHFHANFYDVMPPFVLGVEEAVGFGDFGTASGPIPVAGQLAWSVHDDLSRAGYDLSLSYSLTIDHGLVQSYEMVAGGTDVPIVPLVVNTAAPPLPTLDRCLSFGHALGESLRASAFPGSILVIASGGLSHWLPPNDPRDPSVTGERRDALIHGRADVRAFAAVREPRVRAMGGNPAAPVNVEWDRWFLDRLTANDPQAVAELGHEKLEESAGTGGHEVRCWLAGFAAVGRPLRWTSYEPVPEWITGMGIGTTFDVE